MLSQAVGAGRLASRPAGTVIRCSVITHGELRECDCVRVLARVCVCVCDVISL